MQLLSKHPDLEKPDFHILGDRYSIFSHNILSNAALCVQANRECCSTSGINSPCMLLSVEHNKKCDCLQEYHKYLTPLKFKDCLQGKPVYMVQLFVFLDDIGGNRS